MSMQIQLKGVPAVLVLAGIIAFAGWRSVNAHADLDAGAAEELANWLRAEHARDQLRGVAPVDAITPAKLDSLLASQNVTFASVKARGAPDDMLVRAEVLVAGRAPRDPVRYYSMSYSTIMGWRMKREANAFQYYTKIF